MVLAVLVLLLLWAMLRGQLCPLLLFKLLRGLWAVLSRLLLPMLELQQQLLRLLRGPDVLRYGPCVRASRGALAIFPSSGGADAGSAGA